MLIITFVGPYTQKELAAYFLISGIFMLFVAVIWLGMQIRGIKLVSSEDKKT